MSVCVKEWEEMNRGVNEIKGTSERDRWRAVEGASKDRGVRRSASEPDVLANIAGEPQAAQSPLHLTGSQPNLPQ